MSLQSQRSHRSRRALLAALVLALLPVISPVTGFGGAAFAATPASTTLCSGFDSCAAKGMAHGGYKSAKSSMYWNMFSGVNCTNYVAYRMIEAGMPAGRPAELKAGWGNATYWGASFGALTDTNPLVGSVAWWKANTAGSGSAGHVALVEEVLANGDVIISESNYGSEFTWRRLAKSGNRFPTGFIHLRDQALTATASPTISGTPQVGVALKAVVGTWSPSATKFGYRWFADGVEIPGATGASFTPTVAEFGKKLTLRVVAAEAGYINGRAFSVASAPVQPGTQVVTNDPTVEGNPQVDETLTVDPGAYAPNPEVTSIQWLADGTPIAGATATTFVPRVAQANARLTVKVTAAKTGYKPIVRTTAPTEPIKAPQIPVSVAKLEGERRVGQILKAIVTPSAEVGAKKSYAWFRDGKHLSSVTGATYRLKKADVGHAIAATVTVTAPGYMTQVIELGPATGIKIGLTGKVNATAESATSVWVRVTLTPSTGAKPAGRITIKVGTQIKSATLVKGAARVKFTKTGSGSLAIKATYKATAIHPGLNVISKVTVPKAAKKAASGPAK